MLAELSAKEQLYFMDVGAYVPARADNANRHVQPSVGEPATAFIPTNPTAADFRIGSHAARLLPTQRFPLPGAGSACGPAGISSTAPIWSMPEAQALARRPLAPSGVQLWATQPNVPWFYAVAACNLNTSDGTSAPGGFQPTRPSWCSPTTRLDSVPSTTGTSPGLSPSRSHRRCRGQRHLAGRVQYDSFCQSDLPKPDLCHPGTAEGG